MTEAGRKIIEQLSREFPKGCRVVLDEMDDSGCRIPTGGQGVCHGVDTVGSVLASWDCGSKLNVALGTDRCYRIETEEEFKESLVWYERNNKDKKKCPRCGEMAEYNNRMLAVSRRADILICEKCGMQEAMEDFLGKDKMRIKDWAVARDW